MNITKKIPIKIPHIGILIPILLLFVYTTVCLYGNYKSFCAIGPLENATSVVVNKGNDLDDIARLLENSGIIRSASIFRLGVRLHRMSRKLKAGEFFIPDQASAKEVMQILVKGKTITRSITIPEGLPSIAIIELLNNAPGLVGDKIEEIPVNGSLMPETYHYQYGMSRSDIYNRMSSDMEQFINTNWSKRQLELPLHSKKEALVLASIVEKETAKPSEYKKVASVYINRLKKGMKLQADPTVIYAITNGKMDLKRSPTYDELKLDSPFNTYVNRGLPPEPICNPGKGAIDAALNPEETDYIFFVADGRGGHIFTSNFKEHWVLAEKWRRINRRNIVRNRRAAKLAKSKEEKTVKN